MWLEFAALRGAATLKARVLKEVWNIAAVIPVEKNLGSGSGGGDNGNGSNGSSNSSFSGEIVPEENFLGICSRELLARGCELLKRTRTGILPEIYISSVSESQYLLQFVLVLFSANIIWHGLCFVSAE